jgi:hypothetical protein
MPQDLLLTPFSRIGFPEVFFFRDGFQAPAVIVDDLSEVLNCGLHGFLKFSWKYTK